MTDREKLVELLDKSFRKAEETCGAVACGDCDAYGVDKDLCMLTLVANMLLSNGVVVREKGEWKYIGGDEWCCSVCGYVASTEGRWEPMMDDFCRGCGSDMRKEKPEA